MAKPEIIKVYLDGPPGPKGDPGPQGPVGSITGMPAKVMTATQASTSTTLASITQLEQAVGANETWLIEYWLGTGCSGSGGVTFCALAPSGSSCQVVAQGSGSSQSANLTQIFNDVAASGAYNTAVFFNGVVHLRLQIKTGATAGAAGMRFAAGVAGQTASIYSGSSMTARRVA